MISVVPDKLQFIYEKVEPLALAVSDQQKWVEMGYIGGLVALDFWPGGKMGAQYLVLGKWWIGFWRSA